MWFYFALFLLTGYLMHSNLYVSLSIIICILTSCYIKFRDLNMIVTCFIFLVLGLYIYPKISLSEMESFNKDSKNISVSNMIQFNDQVKINGDLLEMIGDIKGKTYKVYYSFKSPQEKKQFQQAPPIFKNCYITYNQREILPNTNALKFNFNEYLIQNQIDGVLNVKNAFIADCSSRSLNIIEHIQQYREQLILKLKKSSMKHIDDIIALSLGETRYLTDERREQLKKLGIYHLYAVSGSHVALVNVFLFRLLLKFNIKYEHAELIVFFLLPIYAVMTGMSPSVLRAVGVVMLFMIIRKMTYLDSLQILSITFILFTIISPNTIHDIGFQLSYIISTFLLLAIPIIKPFNLFYKILIVNLICQLSSLFILILHFNAFQWLGFITNFLFIPLFELIIFPIVMFFMILFVIFGNVPSFIIFIVESLLSETISLIEWIALLPIKDFVVRNLNSFSYFILLVTIIVMCYFIVKKRLFIAVVLFLVMLMCVSINFKSDKVMVKFLDVGQGDAMINYHFDTNKVVMIDTGGKLKSPKEEWKQRLKQSNYTDSVIVPELNEQGFNSIDYLIITHPHLDHMGELQKLSERIIIKNLIINENTWNTKELQMILQNVVKSNTKIIDSKQLETLKVGETTYRFFNQQSENHEDKNETSIVTEMNVFNKKLLFTGDATQKVENHIQDQLSNQYDVLKVGHHGSLTSSGESFISHIRPKMCIISAGRHNKYGLPKIETINTLKANQCKIYNTQDVGMITFTFERNHMMMTTGVIEYNKKTHKNH